MTEGLNYLWPGPSAVSTVVGDRGHVVDPCYTATWRTCESDVGSQLVTVPSTTTATACAGGCHSER